MHHQHSLHVAESRVGLSLLICLLLAVGYMILERLGGTGQSPPSVEVRAGFHTAPPNAAGEPPDDDERQPHVLTIESSDAPAVHTSQRTSPSSDRPMQSYLR